MVGCSDMCFLFVFNPPQETRGIASSNPGAGCVAPNARGAIQGTGNAVRVCEGCSDSKQVRSEFVMLRVIDLHSRANCAEELPDWQELMPALEK